MAVNKSAHSREQLMKERLCQEKVQGSAEETTGLRRRNYRAQQKKLQGSEEETTGLTFTNYRASPQPLPYNY